MDEIGHRREYTSKQLTALRKELREADLLLEGKACVYATGSYGRLEARTDSDLDLFIVGLTDPASKGSPKGSRLRHLDEICIKADLIHATKRLGLKTSMAMGGISRTTRPSSLQRP
ncbi:nucleotidyltransferase domain-containing protein [Pseudorhizobium endolithicum]|uniref:nucleotidyltransferase domain-containing protein n=1 Tax=Pseudorhizobium endolithicum TaxID=1191678 RepID=UPI00115A75D0